MPNSLDFTFSDLIAGYVTGFDEANDTFEMNTSDGRPYQIKLTSTTLAEMLRNLGDGYVDATGQLRGLLTPGRFLHAYGIFYPEGDTGTSFEAKHILLFGKGEDEFRFESPSWWVQQIRRLSDFYLDSEFGPGSTTFDFRSYRTDLTLEGVKPGTAARQETDTLSRLVYGLATAFMMTGNQRYLDAAIAGADYLVEHMCFIDRKEQIAYWYHANDIRPDGTDHKVFASESGDDYGAIPCYEQVYALAGITQVYRLTGSPKLREVIDLTINLFHKHFADHSTFPDGKPRRGYYSHVDPVTLDPLSPSLDDGVRTNRDRKNWNSVGDHIPAYLINLYLATGDKNYADELEELCDVVTQHFQDYDNSPFVQEKFFGDWTPDREYGIQLNRAIVGHNLKIAWNLTRVNNLRPKAEYVAFAHKIAELMPGVGADRQRGGWYDMVERELAPGQRFHRLVWHDRKAWWQQEQGILAYLILNAVYAKPEYAKQARESSAFYNAWMLDVSSGGVYFNVLANGNPFVLGAERSKGSHSMAMYHSAELAFLAALYSNLEAHHQAMDLYFRPDPDAFGGTLRVAPDLMPPKSVKIMEVWLNGQPHTGFDAEGLTVTVPHAPSPQTVRVRLAPITATFSADLLDSDGSAARIALAGSLGPADLPTLTGVVDGLPDTVRTLTLVANDLVYLDPEAVRYLASAQQRRNLTVTVTGAQGQVADALRDSELQQQPEGAPA